MTDKSWLVNWKLCIWVLSWDCGLIKDIKRIMRNPLRYFHRRNRRERKAKKNQFFSFEFSQPLYLYLHELFESTNENVFSKNSFLEAKYCLRIVATLCRMILCSLSFLFYVSLLIRFRCQNICFYLHSFSFLPPSTLYRVCNQ